MADQWEVETIVEDKPINRMKYVGGSGRVDPATGKIQEWEVVNEIDDPGIDINYERIGYQTAGGMAAGALVPPSPITTPLAIGLGSSIAGQIYDIKEERAGRLKAPTLSERFRTAGEDFALDTIVPPAASKAAQGVKRALKSTVDKPLLRRFRPSDMSDFARFGVKPSAGTATGNRSLMIAENALSDFFTSAGVMQKAAQGNLDQLQAAGRHLAKEYGPILTKEETGRLLKIGSKDAISGVGDIFEKLFNRVGLQVGDSPQGVTNTVNMLRTLEREALAGPETGIKAIADDIVGKAQEIGGLPWEALKKHRTKVGDLLKDPHLVSTRNIQSGDLKRLYAALTADMETAALRAGRKTHASWKAADKYFKIKLERDIPILEEIIKKGYDEDVWNIAMRSAQHGGSRLRLLRKQLPKEAWDAVAGTVLGRLGLAKKGAQGAAVDSFSVNTFMTNWADLSPEARRALWDGTKYKDLYKELNSFAKVVGDFKEVDRLANRSRTASVALFFSMFRDLRNIGVGIAGGRAIGSVAGAGPVGAVAGGVAGIGLPYAAAKLITNPRFVRWLSQGVEIAKANPNGMAAHMGRLFVLREREKNPEMRTAMDEVIKGIPLHVQSAAGRLRGDKPETVRALPDPRTMGPTGRR